MSMNDHSKRIATCSYLITAGILAFISLIQLFIIPPDPKNDFVLGYSLPRLIAIISVMVFISIDFVIIFWIKNIPTIKFDKHLNKIFDSNEIFWSVFVLCFFLTGIGIPLLFQSSISFGKYAAFFIRLRPILQLVALFSLETILFLFWLRLDYLRNLTYQLSKTTFHPSFSKNQLRQNIIRFSLSLKTSLGLGLLIIIIVILWLPYHQIGYWLFYNQAWLGWSTIICSFLLLVILFFYDRSILRLISILSIITMLGGTIYNFHEFHRINWYSSPGMPIERLKSNQLFDLLYKNEIYQVSKYSFLSILAENYADKILTIDETIISQIDINEDQFLLWGLLRSVEIKRQPLLTEKQSEYLESNSQIHAKLLIKSGKPAYNSHFIVPISNISDETHFLLRQSENHELFLYPSSMEQDLP